MSPNDATGASPKTAAAIVIGNEILSGKIVESNLVVLARTLRDIGVQLRHVAIVRDEIAEIVVAIRQLSPAHDWLFTSGGVGPTHDDVTVEAASKAFGVPVVRDETLSALIRAHYAERCTDGHLRMALVPEGAVLETNGDLRWPAIRIQNTWLLPGVPEAFRAKLSVAAQKLGRAQAFISKAVYVKMDEGHLKPLLDTVVERFKDVEIGSYPKWFDDTYKTKLTFDGLEPRRVDEACSAFIAMLPPGEPQWVE